MNKVILIGNLTKDTEISTTQNGVAVCRFTIAVSRRFTNAEGERETDFINVIVWRTLADNCHKFLKKGSKAAIVGSVQTRSYDGTDGTKKYITEVVADEVEFISTKNGEGADAEPKTEKVKKEDVSKLEPISDNDLPF